MGIRRGSKHPGERHGIIAPLAEALIIDAVRTPMGRYRGALAGVRPDDLAARAIAAARP